MLLAGDIGGTKTAVGIFSEETGPHTPLAETEVHSGDYPSLEAIAKEFLAKTGLKIDRACFGVAGPVLAGGVKVTNMPWTGARASNANGLDLDDGGYLLKDLEANAGAMAGRRPDVDDTLRAGAPDEL